MSTAAFLNPRAQHAGLTLERPVLHYTLLPPSYPFFNSPVRSLVAPILPAWFASWYNTVLGVHAKGLRYSHICMVVVEACAWALPHPNSESMLWLSCINSCVLAF